MAFTLTNATAGDLQIEGAQIAKGGTLSVDVVTRAMMAARKKGDITISPSFPVPASGMSLVVTAVSSYVDANRVIGHPGDATALRNAVATLADAVNKLIVRVENMEAYVHSQTLMSLD